MKTAALVLGALATAVLASAAFSVRHAGAGGCPPNVELATSLTGYELRVACGLEPANVPPKGSSGSSPAPANFGTDKDIVLPDASWPHVTQAETQVATNAAGTTVVTIYNDLRGVDGTPVCVGGGSYSTDSGATWTLLPADTFCKSGSGGHGRNVGDPVLLYSKKDAKFVALFLAQGCGGTNVNGLGVWTSTDGITWAVGPCAHVGSGTPTGDDRPSGWVDNRSDSPFYGRIYVTFNDLGIGSLPIRSISSTDGGSSWTAPVTVYSNGADFRRNVQATVGLDGTVFLASMDENGGAMNDRQNYLFKSTTGGQSWSSQISMGSTFPSPGATTCQQGTVAAMFNVGSGDHRWRYMGWGDITVSPNSTVHYVYTQHGSGSDPGDIYYTRSIDNGDTWITPVKLNTDTGTRAQWQPSIIASGSVLVATWYDARNTSGNDYEVFSRESTNAGASWTSDHAISDASSPLPEQVDSAASGCFAGDYNRSYMDDNYVHVAWTDGRVAIQNPNNGTWHQQEDVVYDKCRYTSVITC